MMRPESPSEDSIVFIVANDAIVRGAISGPLTSVGQQVQLFETARDLLQSSLPNLPSFCARYQLARVERSAGHRVEREFNSSPLFRLTWQRPGVMKLAGPATKVIDLKGIRVLPDSRTAANFNARQQQGPFKEFGLVANRPQPELFAGFPRYSTRRVPLSIRVRCLVGFVRYPVGFARGSGIGVRRKGADVRTADAVTPINGATRGADIGPLGDMPILLSHHGRGQDGCGDQPSRQNVKSGHSSFSVG
jgi:hypothetical protein